jgi:hypothetical protein
MRAWLATMLLLTACGSKPNAPPPADVARATEGIAFPDLVTPGDKGGLDRPAAPTDRHTERSLIDGAKPHEAAVDHRPGDTWPGGPCFYDWTKWTCTPVVFTYCTATCGSGAAGAAQITCLASCTCTKGGVTKTCAVSSGTLCARCQNAFKAGCCNF